MAEFSPEPASQPPAPLVPKPRRPKFIFCIQSRLHDFSSKGRKLQETIKVADNRKLEWKLLFMPPPSPWTATHSLHIPASSCWFFKALQQLLQSSLLASHALQLTAPDNQIHLKKITTSAWKKQCLSFGHPNEGLIPEKMLEIRSKNPLKRPKPMVIRPQAKYHKLSLWERGIPRRQQNCLGVSRDFMNHIKLHCNLPYMWKKLFIKWECLRCRKVEIICINIQKSRSLWFWRCAKQSVLRGSVNSVAEKYLKRTDEEKQVGCLTKAASFVSMLF